MSGLGLGLLLGTLAANLQQALLLSCFTIFPLLVISGVLVPVEGMPRPIQLTIATSAHSHPGTVVVK